MTQEAKPAAPAPEAGPAPAVPEEPFSAPQEAAPEAAPGPEAKAETPEKLWLHEVESEDAAWDHEKFQSRREGIETAAHDSGRLEAQQEASGLFGEEKTSFDGFTQQLRSLLGRFNKAASDGSLGSSAIQDLLANNDAAFAAMNKVVDEQYQNQHRGAAFGYFLTELGQELKDPSFAQDFQRRLSFAVRGMDKKFIPDLRKRIAGKDGDERYNDGFKKGLKEGREAQAAQQQVETGKKSGPNLAPGSPAGGISYRTKAEARTLHAQNKISNADMRAIKADPNIPEM